MIKILIFVFLLVLGGVVYGLFWWLDLKNYTWKIIIDVWPFWLLSTLIGASIGGLIVLFMAKFAYNSDWNELENKMETEKNEHRTNLHFSMESRESDAIKKQQKANEDSFKANQIMLESNEISEDAKRQIIEMKQDLEQAQKSAFNATKTVERLRKKMAKLETSRG